MQYKYRQRAIAITVTRTRKTPTILILAIFVAALCMSSAVMARVTFADGDADFSLTPEGGAYSVGDQLTVTLSETSSTSDNTSIIDATLVYTDNLQYVSSSQGTFSPCDITDLGNGNTDINCVSATPLSGPQSVATITFTALSAGPASVSIDPSSDIEDNSGNSVWDGVIPVAAYTINTPGLSGDESGGSSDGETDNSGGTSSGSTPTAGNSPQSAGTSPGTSGTQPSTPIATATLTLTVTDRNHKPLKGAKVTIDNRRIAYTSSRGNVVFSELAVGTHAIAATMRGMVAAGITVSLSAHEKKSVSLELVNQASPINAVGYVALALTVFGAMGYLYTKRSGHDWRRHLPFRTTPGIVVGSGLQAPVESPNPVPTIPPAGDPRIIVPDNPESDVVVPTGRSNNQSKP